MWHEMREHVIENFTVTPDTPRDNEIVLKQIEDIYVTDAYHSLSIEGYRVSRALIEKVRSGNWNPNDREQHNAMAARGYWQAYLAVRDSIKKILDKDNPGNTVHNDHST